MSQQLLPTEAAVLRIEGEMTIYTAVTNLERIRSHRPEPQDFVLDLARVSELDSAGVQLVLYTKQQAEHQGLKFRLFNCSPAVDEVFSLLQLHPLLGRQIPVTPQQETE
jgi:anti-anti-sigma factor